MARSQTNLTVGVGIDTSKFIADSAIIKNELRNIKREVDAAARAGDVGRLQAASAEQARLTQQYAALTQQIRGATAAHKEAVPVFNQLGGAFALMRSNALLVTGAISGVVFGLVKLADSAAKSVDALEDTAQALGITTKQLQAAQLAGAKVGSTAEDVNQGLTRQTRALGEARKQAQQAADAYDLMDDAQKAAFKEDEQKKWRLGIRDNSNAWTRLDIDVSRFPKTAEGNRAAMRALAIGLDGITDASERADIAQSVWGRNWVKQIENIKAGKDGYKEAEKAVDDYGIAVSDTESANSAAWLDAFNTFSNVFGRFKDIVGSTIGAAITPILTGLTQFIVENQAVWKQWADAIAFGITTVSQSIQGLWTLFRYFVASLTMLAQEIGAVPKAFVDAWDAAFAWFGQKVNTVLEWFNWIIEKGKQAASFLGLGGSTAGGDGSVTVPVGAATGGYVSGPGTGTSDSILARLSNGEFVLNAASVRRLGVGFLHGLNQFAAGGLVGMPPIRFAEGGLAAAGAGGTPVHLHLGSHSFALAGSAGVVKALVSEAHAQQVRSAGVKPSWFAGRPGGR